MGKGKYEIIEEIARNKTIEEIVRNIAQNPKDDTLNDLSQMLYEDLLNKPDDKIVELYNNNQLQYFLTRMVLNSINSKTSRYYYAFKKYNNNAQELEYEGEDWEY